MQILIQHAEYDEMSGDRLQFQFDDPGLKGRFSALARRMGGRRRETASEPAALSVTRGDRVFVQLSQDRGDLFRLELPEWRWAHVNLIFSPLSSLYRDPQSPLTINALGRNDNIHINYRALSFGNILFLYISPASLISRTFREDLHAIIGDTPVNALVIDRAHAISEWAWDFDPAYRRIPTMIEDIKSANPLLTVAALTADPGEIIRKDILEALDLRDISPPRRTDLVTGRAAHKVFLADSARSKGDLCEDLIRKSSENADSASGPSVRRYSDPYADVLNADSVSGDPGGKDGDTVRDISVKTGGAGLRNGDSLMIRAALADSLESWFYASAAFSRDGRETACVRLAELPDEACENDMETRQTRIPACSDMKCPFGRKELCDMGRQHHLIQLRFPDPVTETCRVIQVADRLFNCRERGAGPLRIPLSVIGRRASECALYRLSMLGVVKLFYIDYREAEPVFAIYGFSGQINEDAAIYKTAEHLKRMDISTGRKWKDLTPGRLSRENGEMERCRLRHAPRIHEWAAAAEERGELPQYGPHRIFFEKLISFVPVLIGPVREEALKMAYLRLWHLKAYLRTSGCRQGMLLMNIRATDEEWRCGLCDHCRKESGGTEASPFPPFASFRLGELEKRFKNWLENDREPFDAHTADTFILDFADFYFNLVIRCRRMLERRPRNVKALYILRELSAHNENTRNHLELMRVVNRDLKVHQAIRVYETSRADGDMKRRMFELLDDVHGAMNAPEGERWLHREARNLGLDHQTVDMLRARMAAGGMERIHLGPAAARLKQLLKEF